MIDSISGNTASYDVIISVLLVSAFRRSYFFYTTRAVKLSLRKNLKWK